MTEERSFRSIFEKVRANLGIIMVYLVTYFMKTFRT